MKPCNWLDEKCCTAPWDISNTSAAFKNTYFNTRLIVCKEEGNKDQNKKRSVHKFDYYHYYYYRYLIATIATQTHTTLTHRIEPIITSSSIGSFLEIYDLYYLWELLYAEHYYIIEVVLLLARKHKLKNITMVLLLYSNEPYGKICTRLQEISAYLLFAKAFRIFTSNLNSLLG